MKSFQALIIMLVVIASTTSCSLVRPPDAIDPVGTIMLPPTTQTSY